jgi:hypothetical protein
MPVSYDEIPDSTTWDKAINPIDLPAQGKTDQQLLSVNEAVGNHEGVLAVYDELQAHTRFPYLRSLINVYGTSSRWVKLYAFSKVKDDAATIRMPYVRALSHVAADKLALYLKCQPDHVDIQLMKLVTINLTTHGSEVDKSQYKKDHLIYLNEAEVLQLLLRFKDYLAYQNPVYDKSKPITELHLCDTRAWTNHPAYQAQMQSNKMGVAGFAMTFSRNLYAGIHVLDEKPSFLRRLFNRKENTKKKNAFYHSSYICGEPVVCTGCIGIENGKVVYVNNFSGHYAPPPKQLVYVLDLLRCYGVRLGHVTVDYMVMNKGNLQVKKGIKATDFVTQFGA